MGEKIKALKWAISHRIDREGYRKFEYVYPLPPPNHSSTILAYLAIAWFLGFSGVGMVVGLIGISFGPSFAVALLGGAWFLRASIKSSHDWLEKNYEITIRRKER